MATRKTAALPLASVYALTIVYASLYPFGEWRDQGNDPWAFLLAPWPKYWTWFDLGINILGYAPFGALLALALFRRAATARPLVLAIAVASVFSLSLEALQAYLPMRVASREDWLLNSLGAGLGAGVALLLERAGALQRWNHIRRRWFVPDARGGLVLLALWPVALLFPSAVPLGLGQVWGRLLINLHELLRPQADLEQPLLHYLVELLPPAPLGLTPLSPVTELGCVAIGVVLPSLLGYCVIPAWHRRVLFGLSVVVVGVGVSTMSAALSWGPSHAWAWLNGVAQMGLVVGALMAFVLTAVPWRTGCAIALVAMGAYLSLLNQAPESPYFAQILQTWEQGRFIRFNGLAQWCGWLWPYAAGVYFVLRLGQGEAKIYNAP
jgi:VanZ family protein